MSKVWVPIDLPEGAYIEAVVVRLADGSEYRPTWLSRDIMTAAPEVAGPSAARRERWEYDYIDWHGTGDHATEKWRLNQLGSEGWEAYHAGDVTWFKRRLP